MDKPQQLLESVSCHHLWNNCIFANLIFKPRVRYFGVGDESHVTYYPQKFHEFIAHCFFPFVTSEFLFTKPIGFRHYQIYHLLINNCIATNLPPLDQQHPIGVGSPTKLIACLPGKEKCLGVVPLISVQLHTGKALVCGIPTSSPSESTALLLSLSLFSDHNLMSKWLQLLIAIWPYFT